MLKMAICDYDDISLTILFEHLQLYVNDNNIISQIDIYTSGEQLLQANKKYDIYFLDCILPGMNGIELGKNIRATDKECYIIYISADSSFAIDAYDLKTYAYLLKPYDQIKLYSIMDEIVKLIRAGLVIINTPNGEVKIKSHQIKYINIENRNPSYHLTNGITIPGKCLRTSFGKSLGDIKNSPNFILVSSGLIININEIHAMGKDHIIFNDYEKLYFPKSKYEIIHDLWSKKKKGE